MPVPISMCGNYYLVLCSAFLYPPTLQCHLTPSGSLPESIPRGASCQFCCPSTDRDCGHTVWKGISSPISISTLVWWCTLPSRPSLILTPISTQDDRLMVCVGPDCIHDKSGAIAFAQLLLKAKQVPPPLPPKAGPMLFPLFSAGQWAVTRTVQ